MQMHNPPHPGEVLKELCIEPLNLTVTSAAEALGVSRKALSAILNGKEGISLFTFAANFEVRRDRILEIFRNIVQGLNVWAYESGKDYQEVSVFI